MPETKCEHIPFEWPAQGPVHEWRIDAEPPKLPKLVQWCTSCGAIREIEGTRIGVWVMPGKPNVRGQGRG